MLVESSTSIFKIPLLINTFRIMSDEGPSKEGSSNSKKGRPAHYAPDPDDPDGPGIYHAAQPGTPRIRKRGEADEGTPWLLHPHEHAALQPAKKRCLDAVKVETDSDGTLMIASKGDLAVAAQYQALLWNEVQAPAPALVMMAVEEDWRPDERAPRASNGGFPAAGAPGVYAPRAPELAHYFVRVPDDYGLPFVFQAPRAPGMSERARAPVPVREKKKKKNFTCKFCAKTKEGPGYVVCRGCRARFCSPNCKTAHHDHTLCKATKTLDVQGNLLRSVKENAPRWAKLLEDKPDKKFFTNPAPNLKMVNVVKKYVKHLPSDAPPLHPFSLILVTEHPADHSRCHQKQIPTHRQSRMH